MEHWTKPRKEPILSSADVLTGLERRRRSAPARRARRLLVGVASRPRRSPAAARPHGLPGGRSRGRRPAPRRPALRGPLRRRRRWPARAGAVDRRGAARRLPLARRQPGRRHAARRAASAAGWRRRKARRARRDGARSPISISRAPAATATVSSPRPIAPGPTCASGSTTTTTAIPDRGELYKLEDWRIESFALDFARVSRSTAASTWKPRGPSVTVRPAPRRTKVERQGGEQSGQGVVTEVHLPLLSAPTAAVGTPVPLA